MSGVFGGASCAPGSSISCAVASIPTPQARAGSMAGSRSGGSASASMLAWQYRAILSDLQELQRHASDPTCPCVMADLGEWCIPKHALGLASVALETAAMDHEHSALWGELGEAAMELHTQTKDALCQRADMPDVVTWARSWRKKVEPVYYSCPGARASHQAPAQALQNEPTMVSHPEYRDGAEVALCPLLCGAQGGAQSPKPRCRGAQRREMEFCIKEWKEDLPTWCLEERAWGETREGVTCINPRAVCQEAMGCRLGKRAGA